MNYRHSDTTRRMFCALAMLGAVVSFSSPSFAQSDKQAATNNCRKHLKQAHEGLKLGAYDAMISQADSALAFDSSCADAFYLKGIAQVSKGDTSLAVTTLTHGVQLAPLSSHLKLFLARLRLSGGNLDAAEELVNAVLAVMPREGEALYLKGVVKMQGGDTAAALDLFHQALKIELAKGGRRP